MRRVRRRAVDKWVAAASVVAYLALGAVATRDPHARERTLFHEINQGGGSAPALRLPQQLGTPWLLPAVALVGWVTKRPHLVASATIALPLEKGLEVGVKKLVNRRRPAQVLETELHDDAPTHGPSYPSGHAAIATCGVVLAAPYLPVAATTALTATVAVTAYTRVHQGAHFPLDALGGVLLGLGSGSLLNYGLGLPAKSLLRPASQPTL
jgi:membrane-associated phospholipid phosphatase